MRSPDVVGVHRVARHQRDHLAAGGGEGRPRDGHVHHRKARQVLHDGHQAGEQAGRDAGHHLTTAAPPRTAGDTSQGGQDLGTNRKSEGNNAEAL